MQMRSPVARLERKRTSIPTVAVTNKIYREDLRFSVHSFMRYLVQLLLDGIKSVLEDPVPCRAAE